MHACIYNNGHNFKNHWCFVMYKVIQVSIETETFFLKKTGQPVLEPWLTLYRGINLIVAGSIEPVDELS